MPPAVADRLWGHDPATLEATDDLVIAAVLELGEPAEIRWLRQKLGDPRLAAWVLARGARLLSRRSRAFWAHVLGVDCPAAAPEATALWLLA